MKKDLFETTDSNISKESFSLNDSGLYLNKKIFSFRINYDSVRENFKSFFEINLKDFSGSEATVVLEMYYPTFHVKAEETIIVVSGTDLTVISRIPLVY